MIRLCVALLIVTILNGCVYSDSELYKPSIGYIDGRLFGTWHTTDDQNLEGNFIKIRPATLADQVYDSRNAQQIILLSEDGEIVHLNGVRIGSRTILEYTQSTNNDEVQHYWLLMYQFVDNDKLQFFILNRELLTNGTRSKLAQWEIPHTPGSNLVIHRYNDLFFQWINEELTAWKPLVEYVRVQ
jgi:hypothetical protein